MARTYIDKVGRAIALGDTVRIQRSAGRHGLVTRIEGVANALYADGGTGISIELSADITQTVKGGVQMLRRGTSLYCALDGHHQGKEFWCYRKFEDFEHGHEAWVEVVSSATGVARGEQHMLEL